MGQSAQRQSQIRAASTRPPSSPVAKIKAARRWIHQDQLRLIQAASQIPARRLIVNSVALILYHFEMQSPIAKQRVRTIKQLQQGLSLPIIPERAPSSPHTSTRSRSSKKSGPCISEAALSPEEEHLQGQIRLILRNSPKINQEHSKTQQNSNKRTKPVLPPLPNHSKNGQNALSAPPSAKSRSRSARGDLSSIMREQQHYVQLYFAELARRRAA